MKDFHLLIVGNELNIQQTLVPTLLSLGYDRVEMTANPEQVFTKMKTDTVDMVFLELNRKNYLDVVEISETISTQFHIPFVYVMAAHDKYLIEKAEETEPFGIIHHPEDAATLSTLLKSAANFKGSVYFEHFSKLHLIFEASPVGMYLTDMRGKLIKVNPAYCRLLGYTPQELLGKDFTLGLAENIKKYAANLHREFLEGSTDENSGEWEITDQEGNPKELRIMTERIVTATGVKYKLSTVTEITEKNEEIKKLRKALHEKDAFVKETLHRVKNNFNVIAGLFFLQSQKIKEHAGIYRIIQKNIGQVKTLALAYEQLYTQGSSEINLKEYLTSLSYHIQTADMGSAQKIAIDLSVEAIVIDIEKAVTCGMIIYEVLTYMLQVVSVQNQSESIVLNVHRNIPRIVMTMKGSGVHQHLPPSEGQALDLPLIKILSAQLKGELQVEKHAPDNMIVVLAFEA